MSCRKRDLFNAFDPQTDYATPNMYALNIPDAIMANDYMLSLVSVVNASIATAYRTCIANLKPYDITANL